MGTVTIKVTEFSQSAGYVELAATHEAMLDAAPLVFSWRRIWENLSFI